MMNLSSSPNQIRIRNTVLFALSAGLFIYVLLRAYLLSFTTDENGTFTMFLQKGIILPQQYDVYSANDHILNTALMMISSKLFGIGELALRLPNVLFYLLFLWSTAKIACRFNHVLFSIGAFMLLNFHPFLIQYFSLARGYGIAVACSAAAIYYLLKYLEDEGRMKQLLLVNFFGALMVFANFIFMNLYLPIIGFLFILVLWQPRNTDMPPKERLMHLVLLLLCVAAVLVPAVHILLQMKEANALFAGAKDFFWDTTIRSLFLSDLMDAPYAVHLIDNIVLIIEIALGVITAIILFFFIRDLVMKRINVFPVIALGILLIAGTSVYLQHVYLGTPFATVRMALFYLFPFFLALTFAFDVIPLNRKYVALFPFAIGMLFGIHFFRTSGFHHSYGWNYGEDNRDVADMLIAEHAKNPAHRIRLSYSDQFDILGFDYYKIKNKMSWLDMNTDSTFMGDPMNDLTYVSPDRRKFIPDSSWTVITEFHSGNVIMKPKQIFHPLALSMHMGMNVLGKKDPAEPVLNSKHGAGGFIAEFKDTIPKAERFLFTGTIDVKQSEESHGALYLVIEHDHHQYYSKNWDLRLLRSKTDAMETITVTAPVPEGIADGDMISFFAGYVDGEPLEVNNIRIDLDAYSR